MEHYVLSIYLHGSLPYTLLQYQTLVVDAVVVQRLTRWNGMAIRLQSLRDVRGGKVFAFCRRQRHCNSDGILDLDVA